MLLSQSEMSVSALKRVINHGELYSREFVRAFGESQERWLEKSWFSKEKILMHAMVCVLLANAEKGWLIPSPEPEGMSPKRQRMSSPGTSYQRDEEMEMEDVETGFTKRDNPEILAEMGLKEDTFRYTVLVGKLGAQNYQKRLLKVNGMEPTLVILDIVDNQDKKSFKINIETLVDKSSHPTQIAYETVSHCRVIMINSVARTIKNLTGDERLPGEAKVLAFLMRRLHLLKTSYRINDLDSEIGDNMVESIFVDTRFNSMMEEWERSFWIHKDVKAKKKDLDYNTAHPIHPVNPSDFVGMLEDTSLRKAPFMKWTGKVLPPMFDGGIVTDDMTDSELITYFFQTFDMYHSEGVPWFAWVKAHWENSSRDTFNFIVKKEVHSMPNELRENLQIMMKKTVLYDGHPDLVQESFKPPPKLRYSAWMSHLLKGLAEEDEEHLEYSVHLVEEESEPEHPFDRIGSSAVNDFFRIYSKTRVARFNNKVKNFYSRLGGAYSTSLKKASRSSVAIFPIVSNGQIEGLKKKILHGICLVGLQHSKTPTDKMPFVTIELLKSKTSPFNQFIKKHHFLEDRSGHRFAMRVNSCSKADPAYLAFSSNSTYLAANFLGEINLRQCLDTGRDMGEISTQFLTDYSTWLMERVVEGVLMAVLGRSQDEEALANIRKIYMICLAKRRGKFCLMADPQGLADAVNECLLDSPLALYFAQQIRLACGSFL